MTLPLLLTPSVNTHTLSGGGGGGEGGEGGGRKQPDNNRKRRKASASQCGGGLDDDEDDGELVAYQSAINLSVWPGARQERLSQPGRSDVDASRQRGSDLWMRGRLRGAT